MAGMLSNLFGSDEAGADAQSSSQSADADLALDLSPEIGVQNEMGGTYTDLDGAEHTWSQSNDLSVGLDVQLAIAIDTDLEQSSVDIS